MAGNRIALLCLAAMLAAPAAANAAWDDIAKLHNETTGARIDCGALMFKDRAAPQSAIGLCIYACMRRGFRPDYPGAINIIWDPKELAADEKTYGAIVPAPCRDPKSS